MRWSEGGPRPITLSFQAYFKPPWLQCGGEKIQVLQSSFFSLPPDFFLLHKKVGLVLVSKSGPGKRMPT